MNYGVNSSHLLKKEEEAMFALVSRPRHRPRYRKPPAIASILAGPSMLFLAMASGAPAAIAQMPPCAERQAIVERLAAQFGERPIGIAVTSTGDLLELLTSPEGSWSIIVTKAGGPACLMSAGEGWRGAPAQLTEEPVGWHPRGR